MTFEEAITHFCRGDLDVDFHRFDICQDCEDDPIRLIGPGHIRQTAEGRLELKCYAKSADGNVAVGFDMMNQSFGRQSGELFEADDHYRVEAHDIRNDLWTSDPALIHPSWSLEIDAGMISADLGQVRRERSQQSQAASLRLIFLEQKQKQWTALTRHSEILVADGAIALRFESDGEDRICVIARCDDDFAPAFEGYLLEALQFILCKTLYPAIVDEVRSDRRILELRSRARLDKEAPAMPPLPTSTSEHQADVAALLQAYFQHVADAGDETMWHPLTGYLALARSTSTYLLDAWAIGLSIAIEGVSKEICFQPQASPNEHARVREGIIAWMAEQGDIPENLQNRIGGFLGSLDQTRPIDRLFSLVAIGHVHASDIDNWKSLRNASVHTRRATAAHREQVQIQKGLDQVYRALRLFYMLVFHQIGYAGAFTDYGEKGWPERRYPLPVPDSVAGAIPKPR